jgi:hypothetical protein
VASQPIETTEPSRRSSRRLSGESVLESPSLSSRKSRRVSTNQTKRRTSTLKSAPINIPEESEKPEPIPNRRATRSAQTLPPQDLELEEATPKKTPVKAKAKHTRNKSHQVSAQSKAVDEDAKPARRLSKRLEVEEEKVTDRDVTTETVEEEPVEAPKKKRGRHTKIPSIPQDEIIDLDELPDAPESPKPKKRGRQSKITDVLNQDIVDNNTVDLAEPVAEPAKPKKRGRQSKVTSVTENPQTLQPISTSDVATLEDEPIPVIKPKFGRPSKVPELRTTTSTPAKSSRKTRQSRLSQPTEEVDEPPEPLPALSRKRANTRASRVVSSAVKEMPEIEEVEGEVDVRTSSRTGTRSTAPVVEIPHSTVQEEPESDPEIVAEVVTSARGGKASRGRGRARGRSTLTRQSALSETPVEVATSSNGRGRGRGRGRRTISKRAISAVYDEVPDEVSPPAKRKASGVRSTQRLPTPSEETSTSDVFEDTKSTFSDMEETRVMKSRKATRGRSRSKVLSEEEAPSTIYHSADDNMSSPAQSSVTGKSKRELVDVAKRELEDEIWRERVANGEIGIVGSSDDDEKENAAEEKGKKPTRTVRGKGAKGSGRKAKSSGKKGKNAPLESEVEDDSNGAESRALMVKAMISPMRPGPAIAELDGEESSPDGQLDTFQQQLTPVQSPRRKILEWSPAKIDNVTPVPVANGELTKEEEDMTVEQWMRWVINDEVNRLEEECEKLVKNLEREGERARRLLENLM